MMTQVLLINNLSLLIQGKDRSARDLFDSKNKLFTNCEKF
jgi:hypothetical protein